MTRPLELPMRFRPNVPYKRCVPGIDLPRWFINDIKAIDANIWPIWHEWRILWDDTINQDEGPADNPRFKIHGRDGELVMGYVLTDRGNRPIPEKKWHLWRLSQYGWNHIFNVDADRGYYLTRLVDHLYLQALITAKGKRAWSRHLQEKEIQEMERQQKEAAERHENIQLENKWLLKKGLEAAERGHINPTNPTKDIIYSYKGQGNRSRIERPLTDREGGIWLPDDVIV